MEPKGPVEDAPEPEPEPIHYSSRTPEEFEREAARTTVLDRRSLIYGIVVFALLLAGAWVWKLSGPLGSRRPPQPFEFSVEAPEPEDFELADPQREILVERPEEMPEIMEQEEKPDIHVTAVPIEELVTKETVQTPNVQIETAKIDVEATALDVPDAPVEIAEESPVVTWAAEVISTQAPDYADIYKYEKPNPPDRPLEYMLNRAPRPGRALAVLPKQFGAQDAPSMGRLGPANVNLFGTGDFFRMMTKFGGVRARSAVDSALHWLAVHQEAKGLWDARKHDGSEQADQAVTGLAVLAFMGGGHTARKGEYRRNVLRGVEAIMRSQKPDGGILTGGRMYGHAICTIALCESYGRARDERVGRAARKAVAFCEKAVNPDGGWRYTPNCGVSDMSVTPWVIQALKTAKLAQIKFDNAVFSRALLYVDGCTDQGATKDSNGAVNYQFSPDQDYGQGHPALTSAAMMVRQFSGMGVKNHLLAKGAKLTRRQPPSWSGKNFYLWYYATYAMHNMGGEHRIWWNRRIRDVLIENQCKAGDDAGSWDPEGSKWGGRGGRVYSTALGALCLEVYYRYSEALTSFGVAPDLDELFLQ